MIVALSRSIVDDLFEWYHHCMRLISRSEPRSRDGGISSESRYSSSSASKRPVDSRKSSQLIDLGCFHSFRLPPCTSDTCLATLPKRASISSSSLPLVSGKNANKTCESVHRQIHEALTSDIKSTYRNPNNVHCHEDEIYFAM